jgi:hypothetical protein
MRIHVACVTSPSGLEDRLPYEIAMFYEPAYGTFFYEIKDSYDPKDHDSDFLGVFIAKAFGRLPESVQELIKIIEFTSPSEALNEDQAPEWYIGWRPPAEMTVSQRLFRVSRDRKTTNYMCVDLRGIGGAGTGKVRQVLRATVNDYNTYKPSRLILGCNFADASPQARMESAGERSKGSGWRSRLRM